MPATARPHFARGVHGPASGSSMQSDAQKERRDLMNFFVLKPCAAGVVTLAVAATLVAFGYWTTIPGASHTPTRPGLNHVFLKPRTTEHKKIQLMAVPSSLDSLSPPAPYTYESFFTWFQDKDWKQYKLGMTPSASWFDVNMAITGSRKSWFVGKNMDHAVAVAKRINRFLFMRSIMTSGTDESQASLPMHLLILRLLQNDLGRKHGTVALDAGCGTGWLAEAFAVMSNNEKSRIFGFDIENIDLAQHTVANPNAVNGSFRTPKPKFFQGDLLQANLGMGNEHLSSTKFDVINSGVAVPDDRSSLSFQNLFERLNEGGALTVPVCTAPIKDFKCAADFRLYRRINGQAVKEEGGYNVKFIVPEAAPHT